MKTKIIPVFITALILPLASTIAFGQNPVYPTPNSKDQIPFGKKLPPPPSINLMANGGYHMDGNKKLPGSLYTTFDPVTKSFELYNPIERTNGMPAQSLHAQKNAPAGFHLTKDINTHTQPGSSYPNNAKSYPNEDNFYLSFAVLNNVSYFAADDGIHGTELWRSDGTAEGTFMVKDINPGAVGSNISSIIAANGKLYFSAYTDGAGVAPWVSDGKKEGTKVIKNIGGIPSNYQIPFVKVNNTIFFSANSDFGSALWKTDGTPEGTYLLYNFNATDQYAGYITEASAAGGLLFFSAWTPTYGRELWRSDGTTAGTYLVKDIGPDQSDFYSPLQLTEYNNKLYFSGDDGSGRKLWVSDGTADGTTYALNNNGIIVQTDFLDYNFNFPFPILNNVLYFAGSTFSDGNGLYKFDASTAAGIVLVKDLTPATDVDYIVPTALIKVGNALYFKGINSIGGYHDDLWTSGGETENTQVVKTFDPGQVTTDYYDGYGTLYFNENDPTYGTELWKSDGTEGGTDIVKDIFPGSGGSGPAFITPCNGKIIFNASDPQFGTELWTTDGTDMGTVLVKDINVISATNTDGSDAGIFIKGIAADGKNGVVFGAFTPDLGGELYKSDGTTTGTKLLNDIAAGPDWSYPNSIIFKNGVNYFIGDNLIGTSIYKTDATKGGLQQIVYNIDRVVYYVTNFNVLDNGLPLYILANRNTGGYELWRSDGTQKGTYSINTNLNYNNYIVTTGNIAFFVAGDNDHGYELWKTDGTYSGTKMVKDINAGVNGSYPYSLFAYKEDVYFGAQDGGLNSSFWQSDGTAKGTVKLKNITPAFYDYVNNFAAQYFCISDDILYFDATDFNEFGAELWKTDGTKKGTKLVKDINTTSYPYSSNPANLTDANGILFFTADDGVDGPELWSSDGTARGTNLVKDITPGLIGSNLYSLTNVNGHLYFVKDDILWKSDGTGNNTNQVIDDGLTGLSSLTHLTASGNKLFFGAYSFQYGTELYEGNPVNTTNPVFASTNSANAIAPVELNAKKFDAILYPNPVSNVAVLRITGTAKNTTVMIADITGKTIWKKSFNAQSIINLPVEKLSTGVYSVNVKGETEGKTLKLVKE